MRQVRCSVSAFQPFACTLDPDQPAYGACELAVDYTEALLSDLGPALLMLYASYAGPPVTRDTLVEMVQPMISLQVNPCDRQTLLALVREGYPPVLARGRERVEALGGQGS